METDFERMVVRAKQTQDRSAQTKEQETAAITAAEYRRREASRLIPYLAKRLPLPDAVQLTMPSRGITLPGWNMGVRYMIADGEHGPDFNHLYLGNDTGLYAQTNRGTLQDGRIPVAQISIDDKPSLGYFNGKPTSELVLQGLANLVVKYNVPL